MILVRTMMEYRRALWSSWTQTRVTMTDIPVNKAQLLGRAIAPTAEWMGQLNPTWRAVRDAVTGHSIHVVSDSTKEKDMTDDLRLGLRLMNWMSSRPMVWYWWDHDWPRIVPPHVAPGRIHVNGGWAVPGVMEVHVYRREEAHKVLLHEMIHVLGMDVPQTTMDPIRDRFEKLLNRRLWPHLGEAFTEFFAEWLWAIASAPSLKGAASNWTAQLACAEMQAKQVWGRIRDLKTEDTSIFAYYILKWVLTRHCEEVLYSPVKSVVHWIEWWEASRSLLDSATSASETLRLGMTCQ